MKLIRNATFTVLALIATTFSVAWHHDEVGKIKVSSSAASTIKTNQVTAPTGSLPLNTDSLKTTVRLGESQAIIVRTLPNTAVKLRITSQKGEAITIDTLTDTNGEVTVEFPTAATQKIGVYNVVVEAANNKGKSIAEHRYAVISWGEDAGAVKYYYPIIP